MSPRRTLSPFDTLPARDPAARRFNVIVETPKGSRCKNGYDPELGVFRIKFVMPVGLHFPYDFGYIPRTRGEDGDPLDVLLLLDVPTFVGCLVPTRLIGVLEARQTHEGKTVRNDRLIGVLEDTSAADSVESILDLPKRQRDEIGHFFVNYNKQLGKKFTPLHWRNRAAAEALVKKGENKRSRGE